MIPLMDINQLVLMFLVVMSASFFGVGLWLYLAVDKYIKFVRSVRQEELDYQKAKKEEYARIVKDYLERAQAGKEGGSFDGFDDKGGFIV